MSVENGIKGSSLLAHVRGSRPGQWPGLRYRSSTRQTPSEHLLSTDPSGLCPTALDDGLEALTLELLLGNLG